MKIHKIIVAFVLTSFLLVGCKNEAKKEVVATNTEKVNLTISGMTCEIGCAKTIQSKLSKKEGIIAAKVIFKDSLASVEFDAKKISKSEIITFINGIAEGKLYKATETDRAVKTCGTDCTKPCCAKKKSCDKTKKDCKKGADCKDKKDCKKTSCDKKGAECTKKDCDKKDCKKGATCDKKDGTKTTCKPDCTKPCCAKKEVVKEACAKDCKKACCAKK